MNPPVQPPLHALADTLLSAFDNTGIGVTVVEWRGDQYELTYCNRRYCEITGYQPAEVAQLHPMAMLDPAEHPRILAYGHGELPRQLETVLVSRTGEKVPVEISMCDLARPGGRDIVTFVRDIRERKRFEDALRESEARFRSLAEASPDAITVIMDGRMVYANPASVALLGFGSADELLERPLGDLLMTAGDAHRMAERIRRITEGEHLGPREFLLRRKDGAIAVQEISSTRTSFDGRPALLSFGRDTRERRAWQAEMVRGDRLATIGMIAASVAHEINNPLTYTLIHLDRLAETVPALIGDLELRRDITTMIMEAREGGERVRAIVRDLLTATRQEPGTEPVYIDGPLETAIKLAGQVLTDRARVVRRIVPVPPVAVNASRLSQLFLNLVLNAADAFDGPDERNQVTVEVDHVGGRVRVVVADNGRGIRAEDRARIFEPFFSNNMRSTGLGLAICANIVAAAGGEIGVDSEPGGGTRMTVHLPSVERSSTPAEVPSAPTGGGRVRVAVVDDDSMLVEAVASLVATRHEAERFTDPRAALEHFVSGPAFDHVLCDIHMPGLNGAELYTRLCERRPEYRSRFTFITGGALSGLAADLVARGDVGLLPKPFDMRAVLAAVERGSNR